MKAPLSLMLFTATALVFGSLSTARADIPPTSCGVLKTDLYAPSSAVFAIGPNLTTFVSFSVVVGGMASSCFTVSVSANVGALGPNPVILLRALLDGKASDAGLVPFVPIAGAETYIFAFANVKPGLHVLQMQGPSNGATQAQITDFAMLVGHK